MILQSWQYKDTLYRRTHTRGVSLIAKATIISCFITLTPQVSKELFELNFFLLTLLLRRLARSLNREDEVSPTKRELQNIEQAKRSLQEWKYI